MHLSGQMTPAINAYLGQLLFCFLSYKLVLLSLGLNRNRTNYTVCTHVSSFVPQHVFEIRPYLALLAIPFFLLLTDNSLHRYTTIC